MNVQRVPVSTELQQSIADALERGRRQAREDAHPVLFFIQSTAWRVFLWAEHRIHQNKAN